MNVTNLTLSAWIKSDTLPSPWRGCIAGRGYSANATGFGLYLENNGTANFQTRQGDTYVLTAAASYPFDGNWHHLAGVRDGNFTRLYIDGELVAQEEGEIPSMSSGHAFCLGARSVNANLNYYYNGSVAEVRLWDYARSTEKIDRERYYKMRGDEPGLIGYWPCDEGLDVRVYDGTSSSNNGIFVSSVAWEYTVDFMRDRPPPGILLFLH